MKLKVNKKYVTTFKIVMKTNKHYNQDLYVYIA